MTGRSKVRRPEACASVANRQPANPAFGLIHPIHSFIPSLGVLVTYSFALSFVSSTIHRFIYSFIHLSSAFYRPGSVLGFKALSKRIHSKASIQSLHPCGNPVAKQQTSPPRSLFQFSAGKGTQIIIFLSLV